MKIGKISAYDSQINFAERIDKIVFENWEMSKEIFAEIKKEIKKFSDDKIEFLQSNYKKIENAKSKDEKISKKENLKGFLVSNGIAIAQGVSASALFEFIKKIFI